MNELFKEHVFSVSDLTERLKEVLEGLFTNITVEGEIFDFRPASSGHWYFQLHDKNAAIQGVMFKSKSWRVPFIPKDGDRVTVTGSVSIYAKRGNYQIICETMQKSGEGDLLALLEERKRQFAALGYFDSERKRPLPPYPQKIGVITSPTGAAVRDILQVLKRRNPTISVVVLPAAVQGSGAAAEIAAQIERANRLKMADLLIVGRGGGSLEDLMPFSEKVVIEAIVASEIVVVSAVGHEIDWALSDFAADLRAPTPSAAAELVAPLLDDIIEGYRLKMETMAHLITHRVGKIKGQMGLFTKERMGECFKRKLEQAHLRSDDNRKEIERSLKVMVEKAKVRSQSLLAQLEGLSPLSVLQRGYSIVTVKEGGAIVSRSEQLTVGEAVEIKFAQGGAEALIEEIDK
ncbi:MAG: exodeoxyribonuclease VII large subunit [Spirochaetales bacterium]|nr:exodeoxyribonuclease VII large subunit [Spirochaetales bacterium]